MEQARIGDIDLAFEVRGEGEPILFSHGAFIADALRPLAEHPLLADFQIIRYHRRGYGASEAEGAAIAAHAADALGLLDHLGIPSTHILGHSAGGAVALQVAATAPGRVKSLTLLEPVVPGAANGRVIGDGFAKILEPAFKGDLDAGTDNFFRFIMGDDAREVIERNIGPDAWTGMNRATAFQHDLGILMAWQLSADAAAAITCPVLFVLGADSVVPNRVSLEEVGVEGDPDMFRGMVDAGMALVQHATLVEIPGIDHALQIRDADAVAKAVAPFLAKNRDAVSA
jgi:pimeloyl-ACP methyl ester carboxylesterase